MRTWVLAVVMALVLVPVALADDAPSWWRFVPATPGPEEVSVDFEDTEPVQADDKDAPPSAPEKAAQAVTRAVTTVVQSPVLQGEKGDKGEKGEKGDTGPPGPAGESADLCGNLPGVNVTPGWKIWPQRYWGFRPRKEKRVLALNRRGHLVCVTQRWIRKHGVTR